MYLPRLIVFYFPLPIYRKTSAKLFADDCFDLAKERLYGNNPLQITGGVDYAVAIEWAEASLEYVRYHF